MEDKDTTKNKELEKVNKVQKTFNIHTRLKQLNVDEEKEIAYVNGWASKSVDSSGNSKVDRDGEFVDVKGFKIDKARTLLRDHDTTYPIGKMKLTHKHEGVWIDAEVHKAMCEKTYYAVKNQILDSFSIGFMVTDYDFITVKGVEVLRFKAGEIYETSIVSVPSNDDAIMESVKSLIQGNECIGFSCSVKALKAMNPKMDCGCEVNKKEILEETKNIQEQILKGLTIEDTMNELYYITDPVWNMLGYFISTIEDNIYEFKYDEKLSKEEMINNLTSAFDTFKETLTTVSTKIEQNRLNENNIEGNMNKSTQEGITKEAEVVSTDNVESVSSTNTTTVEAIETVQEQTSEVTEEAKVDTPNTEKVNENLKTETQLEDEVQSKEETVTENVEDEKILASNLDNLDFTTETINILKLDLSEAEPEEIRNAYDSLADKLEKNNLFDAHLALRKIEDYLTQELKA